MSKKLCDEYRKESYGTTLPNKQKSFSLPDQSMCISKKDGIYFQILKINDTLFFAIREVLIKSNIMTFWLADIK